MLSLALLLAGCADTRTVTIPKPVTDCSAWHYITVSPDDVLTDETARQIVSHDKNWLRLCGGSKDDAKAVTE